MVLASSKIVSLSTILKRIATLRRSRKTITFTNGCFDLMHIGHVTYLEKAKQGKKGEKRVLIVGLNSDKSIAMIKDPTRPICPQQSRAAVLAALGCVDFVVLFNEETPYQLIKAIQPDVLVKGADYKGKEVVGADIVKARGGKLELIKFVSGFSTTNIINKNKVLMNRSLNRIIDANFNRTKEGLRVCEDVARFIWDDRVLSKQLKEARHQLTEALIDLGFKNIVSSRDIEHDVGRSTITSEKKRTAIADVFFANCQRCKESLRVLEELAKLSNPKISQLFKTIRYRLYAIEKTALKRR